jgi:hypothetical protein
LAEKDQRIDTGEEMSQTRKQSAIEAVMNVVVGFAINFTANMTLFPLFGWSISVEQNIGLGILYTLISLARSYCLRRFYNWRHSSDH